jgi:hypothetical protein
MEYDIENEQQNRSKLADIVYSHESFTEREIEDAYGEYSGGVMMVDYRKTVKGYLDELCDLGALSYFSGRYTVSHTVAQAA